MGGYCLRQEVLQQLMSRGVTIEDIADIVYNIQKEYHQGLSHQDCIDSIYDVLGKREVQNAIMTGIALDEMAEKSALPQPLQAIIEKDDYLYGVDEVLALAIVNVYGSIGFTNFGYLDKKKVGILDRLNREGKKSGKVNTFLDDLVAGVAAAAAARIAHHWERQNAPDAEKGEGDDE